MSLTGGKQRSEMPKEKDEIMASPVISTMVAGKVQIRGCEKTFTCSYTELGPKNKLNLSKNIELRYFDLQ